MDRYILTSVNSVTVIICNNLRFDTNQKPELSFFYDSIYYEPELNRFIKIVSGSAIALSEKEKEECLKYIKGYEKTADYPVYAYNENMIYIGKMNRKEAEKNSLNYRITERPDYPVSKWVNDKWERVYAIITDSGRLLLNPDSFCSSCALFFTENEFKDFPAQPSDSYIYDIESKEWIDPRNISVLKDSAYQESINYFDMIRQKKCRENLTFYDARTWDMQVSEAEAWIKDKTAQTTYLDTFLENVDGKVLTKEKLCKAIIEENKKYIKIMAKINSEQWKRLKLIEKSKTNKEIDELRSKNSLSSIDI